MLTEKRMMERTNENYESLLDQEWLKSKDNTIIRGLGEGKKLHDLLLDLAGFNDAFQETLNCLDCADGRVCSGRKMGLAGQGILLTESDLAILENKISSLNLRVSGHDNCGAANIAFPGPNSDQKGYDFTKNLADKTGALYTEVHRHDLLCQVHNERCLLIENTGKFDAANLPGFPVSFISSASFFGLSEEYQSLEAKALINIALHHGYGNRFTVKDPFYLIISAVNESQLAQKIVWAEELAQDFNGIVKVDGFMIT